MAGVPPVFFKANTEFYTPFDVCSAAEAVVGTGTIVGAQRIGRLWRLYPRQSDTRAALLVRGVVIRGKAIALSQYNPFVVGDGSQALTRLYIDGLPMSFATAEVETALKRHGVVLHGKVTMENIRDPQGQMTNWLSGRRIGYMEIPKSPLENSVKMGKFTARIFHKEMAQTVRCYRCLKEGHRSMECKGEEVCRLCHMTGHRATQCMRVEVSDVRNGGEGSEEKSVREREVEKRRMADEVEVVEVTLEEEREKEDRKQAQVRDEGKIGGEEELNERNREKAKCTVRSEERVRGEETGDERDGKENRVSEVGSVSDSSQDADRESAGEEWSMKRKGDRKKRKARSRLAGGRTENRKEKSPSGVREEKIERGRGVLHHARGKLDSTVKTIPGMFNSQIRSKSGKRTITPDETSPCRRQRTEGTGDPPGRKDVIG